MTVAEVAYSQARPYERDGVADPAYGGLAVTLRDVSLPAEVLPGLGQDIAEAGVDLAISQPWPPALRARTSRRVQRPERSRPHSSRVL